jgi:hypothetical protein
MQRAAPGSCDVARPKGCATFCGLEEEKNMLATSTASLGLSIASGILKLAGRWDRLQAERRAVVGDLPLPMPAISGFDATEMQKELAAHLRSTSGQESDPIAAEDRQTLEQLFTRDNLYIDDLLPFYTRLLPNRMVQSLDPDSIFMKRLDELSISDENARLAAFYIAAGDEASLRSEYGWRLGLIVADVVTELGAESTALFIRDPSLRDLAASVLTRFAGPDLDTIVSWQGLLRHTLQATLNGALDAGESVAAGGEWLDAVLDALANARKAAAQPDNYLIGLLRGRGYRQLVSATLETAASKLGSDGASAFEKIAADLLAEAAPMVEADHNGFKSFFESCWGDLLRAGFNAIEVHGPMVLADESPLLRESLLAIVGQLAKTPESMILSRDTVVSLVDAVVAAAVSNLDELSAEIDEPWLQELVTSVAGVINDQGISSTFSRDGVDALVRSALTTLAGHPELLVKKPGLVQEVVGSILGRLATISGFALQEIADVAVEGALLAVAASPSLLDQDRGQAVAELAGLIAEQMQGKALGQLAARDLLQAILSTLAHHPELLVDRPGLLKEATAAILAQLEGVESFDGQELASIAVEGLLAAAATSPSLLERESGQAIAKLAGLIAGQVKARTLSKVRARDLLQAALVILAEHPQLVVDEPGLFQDAVAAVLDQLKEVHSFGAEELASAAVEGLLAAAATSPSLLERESGQAIAQLAGLLAGQVRSKSLSRVRGRDLLRAILKTLAQHPHLVVGRPGLLHNAVSQILDRLQDVSTFAAQELTSAAVLGLLEAAATDPQLLAKEATRSLADLAGLIAEQVTSKGLTALQGSDLLSACYWAVLNNPELLLKHQSGLTRAVVEAVLKVVGDSQLGLVVGVNLIFLVQGVLENLAIRGRSQVKSMELDELITAISQVLRAGLVRAAEELGTGIDRDALPTVLAALITAWLRGEVETGDRLENNQAFKELFTEIVAQTAA